MDIKEKREKRKRDEKEESGQVRRKIQRKRSGRRRVEHIFEINMYLPKLLDISCLLSHLLYQQEPVNTSTSALTAS